MKTQFDFENAELRNIWKLIYSLEYELSPEKGKQIFRRIKRDTDDNDNRFAFICLAAHMLTDVAEAEENGVGVVSVILSFPRFVLY